MSAVDTRSIASGAGEGRPTGPKTGDVRYEGGDSTVPGPTTDADSGVFQPGSYEDKTITLAPGAGNAAMTAAIDWDSNSSDWDLYIFRKEGDELVEVGRSANGALPGEPQPREKAVVPNPPAGDYVVRVRSEERRVGKECRSRGSPYY